MSYGLEKLDKKINCLTKMPQRQDNAGAVCNFGMSRMNLMFVRQHLFFLHILKALLISMCKGFPYSVFALSKYPAPCGGICFEQIFFTRCNILHHVEYVQHTEILISKYPSQKLYLQSFCKCVADIKYYSLSPSIVCSRYSFLTSQS